MATKVEELRKKIVHNWWFEQDVLDQVDALIVAAKEEGSAEMMERVRKSVVIRYYPDSMNGGKLEPLQCLDGNVLAPKEAGNG